MENWLEEAIKREATPKALRQETVEQFADKWGITSSKYFYEMSKKENWAKILEISLNKAKTETPEILEKLTERAKNGEIRAIEMFLDYILKLAKNLDIKSDGKPLIQIAGEIANKYGITPNTENSSEVSEKV